MNWVRFLLTALSMLGSVLALAQATPKRIIFDTDPGTDDALALMLALSSADLNIEAITVVPVRPLTDIALAVSEDPSIAGLAKDSVIMGGSMCGGNSTGAAEANIYNDPEAAQTVFNPGWIVTMVGLDVGNKTLLTDR